MAGFHPESPEEIKLIMHVERALRQKCVCRRRFASTMPDDVAHFRSGENESTDRQPNPRKEIESMWNRKASCFVVATLLILAAAGTRHGFAQVARPCFTLASLKGSFTIVGNYGANVAIALGKRYVDGDGNLAGTFLVNKPVPGSATGDRAIVTGTQLGTYTVNCDGTGIITRVLTVGTTQTTQIDDFVITGAFIEDGKLVATSVADATRTPSTIVAGGIFLTRVWTRVP